MRDPLKRNVTAEKRWINEKNLSLAFNVLQGCQKAFDNYGIIFQEKGYKFCWLKWGSEDKLLFSSVLSCYPAIIQKQIPREFPIWSDRIWDLAVFQMQSVEVSLVFLWLYQEWSRGKNRGIEHSIVTLSYILNFGNHFGQVYLSKCSNTFRKLSILL